MPSSSNHSGLSRMAIKSPPLSKFFQFSGRSTSHHSDTTGRNGSETSILPSFHRSSAARSQEAQRSASPQNATLLPPSQHPSPSPNARQVDPHPGNPLRITGTGFEDEQQQQEEDDEDNSGEGYAPPAPQSDSGSNPQIPPAKNVPPAIDDNGEWGPQSEGMREPERPQEGGRQSSLVPRPLDLRKGMEHMSAPSSPAPPDTARKVPQDGYKLQPVAYSPAPEDEKDTEQDGEEDEDEEEITEIIDDVEVDENEDKESQGRDEDQSWDGEDEESTQSVRDPSPERRSIMPQAPQLPLLFFESEQVDQIDFAYQQKLCDSSRRASQSDRNDLTSNDSTATVNGNTSTQKPSTTVDTGVHSENKHEGVMVDTPQRDGSSLDNVGRVRDEEEGSFYWHSSHSSTDEGSQDQKRKEPKSTSKVENRSKPASKIDNKPRPEFPTEHNSEKDKQRPATKSDQEPLILKKIISTIPENGLTSATISAFGGPSDWEHFGDYDAEEVDDIALYTSNKPKTAELPGASPPQIPPEQGKVTDHPSSPRSIISKDRDFLPTIQERTFAAKEDEVISQRSQETASVQRDSHHSTPKDESSTNTESKEGIVQTNGLDGVTPPTAEPNIIRTPSNDQAERTRSPPPAYDDQNRMLQNNTRAQEQSEHRVMIQDPHTLASATIPDNQRAVERRDTESPSDERSLHKQTSAPENLGLDGERSRVMSGHSVETSTLSSPIDDDDGKENIIITLQVPESPPHSATLLGGHPDDMMRGQGQGQQASGIESKTMDSLELLGSGRRSIFPQSIELEDPYSGLDPWAKASLNRYVKMLKEEAAAETDEEKFETFINFTHKETRVRAVLYDMDDESDISDHPSKRASVKSNRDARGSLKPRLSVRSKALPALPQKNNDTPPVPKVQIQNVPIRTETMPVISDSVKQDEKRQSVPSTAPPQKSTFLQSETMDDSFVMTESPPGDDKPPSKPKTAKERAQAAKGTPSLSSLKKALEIVATRSGSKENVSQPNSARDGKGDVDQKSVGTPRSVRAADHLDVDGQQGSGPEKAGHPDFKFNEGRAYEGDKAANRQTIYRPFSTLLRQTSVRHSSADISAEKAKHHEAHRKAHSGEGDVNQNGTDNLAGRQLDIGPKLPNYRYTVLEPLLIVIPEEGILDRQPQKLVHLRQSMDAIPDDFSFIHQTVLAWDAEAKKAREQNERERHVRSVQNEARIDALFNENEIGYGDINELEAEFKRDEVSKKAEEDRKEVQTFVSGVFDVVWARINYEMDRLAPLYEECTLLVQEASAGRDMFVDTEKRVPIAPAMEILLNLYQKLMVRHQKAFEAVLERDRRLKKTEVAPWYAQGSIEKVKRIEKRFDDAEKKAILEFCRQRDERANLLMDVLDQNTLRGVGANQDYMESIMQAVRKIAIEVGQNGPGPDAESNDVVSSEEVLKAETVTTALARSSEQIVQTFHSADMLLNAADYEVSVASAKLKMADSAAFKRLREAKAKEDSKLTLDLEHRMSMIRCDRTRTQDEISKLMRLIRKMEGRGDKDTEEIADVDPDDAGSASGARVTTGGGSGGTEEDRDESGHKDGKPGKADDATKAREGGHTPDEENDAKINGR